MKKTEEVLLIDIQELINAYHEGLADNIAKRPTDTNVNIGMAQPLTSMQMILETNLVASELSFAKLAATLVEEQERALRGTSSIVTVKGEKSWIDRRIDEIDEYTSQYAECYTTDIKGKRQEDIDFFTDDTLTESSWDEGKALHKQRLTNDLNYKLMMPLTKDFDEKYFGKKGTVKVDGHDLNFGLEKCFDCVIKVNLSYAMPALEFTFNFAKQLKKLKELLKQINADLDPTKILSMICQMSLNFGKNLICPSNLLGIGLLLPHLFTKYSLDLVKLRFDWTVVLGPIMKTIIGSIVSFVENIPRLIVPFIDCFINVFKNTIKWISTMMSSAENVYNAAHTGIEKTAQLIDRAHTSAKQMLEATSLLDSKLEALEEELKKQKNIYNDTTNNGTTNKDTGIWLQSSYREINYRVSTGSESEEALRGILYSAFKSWRGDNNLEFTGLDEAMKTQMRDFLVANPQHLKAALSLTPTKSGRQQPQMPARLDDYVTDEEKEEKKAWNRYNIVNLERAIAKETLAAKNRKKYFRLDGVAEDTHRKHSVAAFRKIGFDLENKYKESPFKLPLKANFESGRKAVKDLITHYTIRHLEATKSWILQTAGNVILALKSIEKFLGEYIETDLKILGNIQEILHLIRFYRLLYELIKNGLTGCDKIKENKQVFETILQESNQELVLDDSILEKQNLDPQDHIALKSKDGRYSTIIDLNQCNEVMNHINVNENNLDSIYDGILNGIYT
jgi:hypothetical protein